MATQTPDADTPDASLTADESFTATSSAGLTYPWGDFAPGQGQVHRIAEGISWARIPMPGSLGHINSWLLDDEDAAGAGYAVVDAGMLLKECSDAWKALFAGDLADLRVTRVLGTHLHPDHIGLAGWLCKRFETELWMTRGEWLTARMLISDVRDDVADGPTGQQRWSGEVVIGHLRHGFGEGGTDLQPGRHKGIHGGNLAGRTARAPADGESPVPA